MNRLLILQNPIMHYDWGSRVHIPELFGAPTPSDQPQAELWMGTHPKAPSSVGARSLAEIIADDPVGMLGAETARRYANRLPFLFKLLAAGTPLSIQAHPNKAQAREGFAAENAAGIALDAPNRNYRDDNHKPEILCALSEFWGLNGFRKIPEMLGLLEESRLNSLVDELGALRQSQTREGLRQFFHSVVKLREERKRPLLEELLASAHRLETTRPEYPWIIKIAELYPDDIGVLSVLLLNLIKLEPGQAMFAAAGDLHAYLDGFGVELMANSDNVLRGGLTPKHVDIPELMKALTFLGRGIEVIEPQDGRYSTPAEEFELAVLKVDSTQVRRAGRGFEILINVDGDAVVSIPGKAETVKLSRGASVAVPASVNEYAVSGPATLYSATVPKT